MGCGAILNSGQATIVVPPGATVDGAAVSSLSVSKQVPHEVVFADGRRCIVDSQVGAGYVIADVVLWFLLGLIVDGVTGDWKSLDASGCPGVSVD